MFSLLGVNMLNNLRFRKKVKKSRSQESRLHNNIRKYYKLSLPYYPSLLLYFASKLSDFELRRELLSYSTLYFWDNWQLDHAARASKLEIHLALKRRPTLLHVRILTRLGRFDEARDAAEKLIEFDPFNSGAHRAAKLLQKGPANKLVPDIDSVREGEYNKVVMLARVYIAHEMYSESIQLLQTALTWSNVFRYESALQYTLGQSFELSQSYRNAIDCYDKVDPSSKVFLKSLAGLASCLYYEGRVETAKEVVNSYVSTYNGNAGDISANFYIRISLAQYGEAFDLYRAKESCEPLRTVFGDRYPQTLQSDLGKSSVFLLAQGGIGDEIDWSEIYAEVADMFERVAITCDPRLKSIMERSYPRITFFPVRRFRSQLPFNCFEDRKAVRSLAVANFVDDNALTKAASYESVMPVREFGAVIRRSRHRFNDGSRLVPNP